MVSSAGLKLDVSMGDPYGSLLGSWPSHSHARRQQDFGSDRCPHQLPDGRQTLIYTGGFTGSTPALQLNLPWQ